ncbi:MAG TPA: 2Fe-2S iron-sulfur cluster-binding protein, partial [Planctomycetota bacterium]
MPDRAAAQEPVTVTINDREVKVPAGSRLIDVIQDRTGEEVPRFCYHRDLPVVGSCRMCQVEIEAMGPGGKPRKALAISCRTPVSDGMKVWTQSEPAQKARRGVLEFLLKDHPLDCPICDKAGECPLQNFTYLEGQSEGRSHDPRRKRRKRVSLGDVIVLDEERCVLCSRCVRFFPAVEDREQLQVMDIGHRSMIGTFDDRPLEGNYQGNLADICPVGALTLSKFRFQARVWNVRPVPSTCTRCSRGCAVLVDEYRGRVVRIRPRYDAQVNKS